MKIISEQLIRSLGITPKQCVAWIYESFNMKKDAQLPAKIRVCQQNLPTRMYQVLKS